MAFYVHQTVFGSVGIETDDREIIAVIVGSDRPSDAEPTALVQEAARQIDEYYAGKRKKLDLPFTIRGTEFQKRVFIAITRIPYGETRSYADIARSIGHPRSCRAVGTVCAGSTIHLLVPCHRVIKSDGTPGFYGGGESFKQDLLQFEREHKG